MFQKLLELGLIVRNDTGWDLTSLGKTKGGVYKYSKKFGRFITWPESIKVEFQRNSEDIKLGMFTATSIGKTFNISATRTNSILSELGWIKKDAIKGWHLTELGKRLGGAESKYAPSGVSFVRWPERIVKNEKIVIWGDGSVVRDYIFVGDLVGIIGDLIDDILRLFGLGEGALKGFREQVEKFEELISKAVKCGGKGVFVNVIFFVAYNKHLCTIRIKDNI